MSLLRILRVEANRFYLLGLQPRKNAPKILALQMKGGEYQQQKRNYKNFGHTRPEPDTLFAKFYFTLLVVMFIGASVNWRW